MSKQPKHLEIILPVILLLTLNAAWAGNIKTKPALKIKKAFTANTKRRLVSPTCVSLGSAPHHHAKLRAGEHAEGADNRPDDHRQQNQLPGTANYPIFRRAGAAGANGAGKGQSAEQGHHCAAKL